MSHFSPPPFEKKEVAKKKALAPSKVIPKPYGIPKSERKKKAFRRKVESKLSPPPHKFVKLEKFKKPRSFRPLKLHSMNGESSFLRFSGFLTPNFYFICIFLFNR